MWWRARVERSRLPPVAGLRRRRDARVVGGVGVVVVVVVVIVVDSGRRPTNSVRPARLARAPTTCDWG